MLKPRRYHAPKLAPKSNDEVKKAGRKPWQRDLQVLRRLEQTEEVRMRGLSALRCSEILGVSYETTLADYRRLDEIATARLAQTKERLRAQAFRRLDGVINMARDVLEQDQRYTEAVLFNMPILVRCPGRQEHQTDELLMKDRLGVADRHTTWGTTFTCVVPHYIEKRVYRDEKGSAQYRRVAGQVIQALRQAIMDQAKLTGLIVDQKALTDSAGDDLPTALKDMLLDEKLSAREVRKLPSANDEEDQLMDIGQG